MTLRIHLFGPLRLTDYAGGPVSRLRLRAQRLLAFLLLHRLSTLDRDSAAFQLWPDLPESLALSTLRRALNDLRTALNAASGADFILVQSNELRWNSAAPSWLDVEDFERLTRTATPQALHAAIELYTEDLLPGWGDEWLAAERERLRQMRLGALGGLAGHYRALGEFERAIQFAQQLVALDPLVETAQAVLIRLHYAAGDRVAALAQYAQFRSSLWEELGVEPMAETQALATAITHGEPLPAPAGRRVETRVPPAARAATPPPIGREAETAQLNAGWDDAVRGAGRLVIVSGEAGVGKSRLVSAAAERVVRQRGLSLVGQCYEFENALPYQAIVEMLRSAAPLVRNLPLAPAHRAMLARLAPDVLGAAGTPPGEPGPAQDDGRGLLFEALLQTFIALARSQPLLLLLEDVHWAAASTLDWLMYVTPRLHDSRVLIVITCRTGEVDAGHALARLEQRFAHEDALLAIRLQPLSREAHRQLVAQLSGRDPQTIGPTADRLFAETGGNPFFLHEAVRGLIEAGQLKVVKQQWSGAFLEAVPAAALPLPASLRATIAARVERLNEMARMFLRVSAVAGRVFEYEVVRHAGGWSDELALAAVENLAARGFVREGETRGAFAFTHHLVQEAIYSDLTSPRRVYLHRRLAEAVQAARPGDFGALAHHWGLAGDAAQEARYAVLAGEQAAACYANDEATQYLRRALALATGAAQRVEIMLRLGQVWQLTGLWPEAEHIYREALALTETLADQGACARCQAALGRLARLQGHYPEALAWLERAQAAYEAAGDQLGLSESMGGLGAVYWSQLHFDRALDAFERQLQIARAMDNRRQIALALGSMGVVFTDQRNYPRALACFEQSLAIDLELGDRLRLAKGIGNLGTVYQGQGDYRRALACYAQMLQATLELGDRQAAAVSAGNMIRIFTALGKYATAEQVAGQALSLARSLDVPMYLCEFLYDSVELYVRQGRFAEAQTLNEEAFSIADRVQRADVRFAAQVMSIGLGYRLGRFKSSQAVAEFDRLLAGRSDEGETAALHYAIWQIEPMRRDARQRAAETYRRLYSETPDAEYRQRYETLTGETLPDPPALPELPVWLRQSQAEVEAKLAQADQLLAALGVAPSLAPVPGWDVGGTHPR